MKNRRTLTLTAVSALAASAAVLPLSLAQAATGSPTASLVVAPTHGTPGTSLTGTITVASCDTPSVVVNGTYVDVNGDPATTPTVTAVAQDATTFTAALSVPADAARSDLSEEPLTFTASVTCATSSPSPSPSATPTATASPTPAATAAPAVRARAAAAPVSATASANVTVDALAEPVVTVTPSTVTVGKAFSFSITGCTGGLADLYTLDGADKDTSVPQGAVDQLSATSYRGTVTIPANATVGAGSLVVECAQAASSGADLELVAAAGSTITTSAAPPATPVIRTPHFTG